MTLAYGILILLLTFAIVVLFAMLGELSRRVGPQTTVAEPQWRTIAHSQDPLEDPPGAVAGLLEQGVDHFIVLSCSCNTCHTIADQPQGIDGLGVPTAILLSCADASAASDFQRDTRIGEATVPVINDLGGKFLMRQCGINSSPSVFRFKDGRIRGAYSFGSMAGLRMAIKELEVVGRATL